MRLRLVAGAVGIFLLSATVSPALAEPVLPESSTQMRMLASRFSAISGQKLSPILVVTDKYEGYFFQGSEIDKLKPGVYIGKYRDPALFQKDYRAKVRDFKRDGGGPVIKGVMTYWSYSFYAKSAKAKVWSGFGKASGQFLIIVDNLPGKQKKTAPKVSKLVRAAQKIVEGNGLPVIPTENGEYPIS